jgi:hypothetical protein
MSLTQWLTRSTPIVRCSFARKAIFNLVPTPSALDTRIGSFQAVGSRRKSPPNDPISERTPEVNVDFARPLMRRTVSLAASMSTPEPL